MKLLTEHYKKEIEKYTQSEDIKYITFNHKTKNIQTYKNIDIDLYIDTKGNLLCENEKVLVFDREIYLENIVDNSKIQQSIQESSFSFNPTTKENLLKFVKNKPTLNYVKDQDIIEKEINKLINNKKQSLKVYNSILRRLKFLCLCLFYKSKEQIEENNEKGIKKRDKNIQVEKENEKISQEWKKQDENIINSCIY